MKKLTSKTAFAILSMHMPEFSYAKGEIERRLPNEPNEAILFPEYVKKTIAIDISSTFQAAGFRPRCEALNTFKHKDIRFALLYEISKTINRIKKGEKKTDSKI